MERVDYCNAQNLLYSVVDGNSSRYSVQVWKSLGRHCSTRAPPDFTEADFLEGRALYGKIALHTFDSFLGEESYVIISCMKYGRIERGD